MRSKAKQDWVRRVKKYADKYIEGDLKETTYLLKDVSNYNLWCALKESYKPIDWSKVTEDAFEIDLNTTGAQACSGGKCEVV